MVELVTEKIQSGIVVGIAGDVDLYSSPEVRKQLLDLTKLKVKNILIDLSRVSYMDSSGVATLVETLQQVNRYKGKLLLFGLDAMVKEVFELSRLDKVFDISGEREAALEKVI